MPVTAQPKGHLGDKPAAALPSKARSDGAGAALVADQPLNEPTVIDDSPNLTPGMFFGIQTKPPAHEQLSRLLKDKIHDIYKVAYINGYLYLRIYCLRLR